MELTVHTEAAVSPYGELEKFQHYLLFDPTCVCINRGEHYNDVIMSVMASQITSLAIVYLTTYSGANQRKHQSSASLAFVWGFHQWPVNSPHKGPVTRKMFPFDDVIMIFEDFVNRSRPDTCLWPQSPHLAGIWFITYIASAKWLYRVKQCRPDN